MLISICLYSIYIIYIDMSLFHKCVSEKNYKRVYVVYVCVRVYVCVYVSMCAGLQYIIYI